MKVIGIPLTGAAADKMAAKVDMYRERYRKAVRDFLAGRSRNREGKYLTDYSEESQKAIAAGMSARNGCC